MKILIVEDSKLYQRAVLKHLQKLLPEAEFFFAADGQEGYQKFLEIAPDVMTIDLLMPKMNGIDLMKKINEHEHNVIKFVLSADVQKIVQEEVRDLGAKFISKPLNDEKAAEIFARIKE